MRLDVRDNTRAAAKAELEHNHCHVMLVADVVVDELAEWSDKIQVRLIPTGDGMVEIEVRGRR